MDAGRPPRPDAGRPPRPDAGPPLRPRSLDPCRTGRCWLTPRLATPCGSSTTREDFSSGRYNVHRYALDAPAGVALTITLATTAGGWRPALILRDGRGVTLSDGERGLTRSGLTVKPVASGRRTGSARLTITATARTPLYLYVTSWAILAGGFGPAMPRTGKYSLTATAACKPPPSRLLTPPNFNPRDVKGGYYLLPPSKPPGLYTRKVDDCSRGTKRLIDVLYTVALRWKAIWPSLAPIAFRDLNKGRCSTVRHSTHGDGTHADLVAGCATRVSCTDNRPAIALAKLFVDTGEVCGILNNDTAVQKVVNAYFAARHRYRPWKGTFMRSVAGHTVHFHIRVKKPDGTCN